MESYSTHRTPSAHAIVSALKTEYPYVYQDLITYYQPLKYDFTLIDALYKITHSDKLKELFPNTIPTRGFSRDLFFGCTVLLFTRSDAKSQFLHVGVVSYASKVMKSWLSNCSSDLSEAKTRLENLKEFKLQCRQIINQINLKYYEI